MATAPKAAAPATMPAPLSAPPSVPMSGVAAPRVAIAPSLTEAPKGQSPEKAFADRSRAAIAKATGQSQKDQDAAAGEDAATPPKPKAPTTAAASTSAKSSLPASGAASTAPTGKASAQPSAKLKEASSPDAPGTSTDSPAPAELTYDLRSLKKWAEDHPEEAAETLKKLGHLPADQTGEYIKLKNKQRKVREEIQGLHATTMAEARAEREQAEAARQAMDGAAGKLAPIADLWEAVREKVVADPSNPQLDFEAADAAFLENSGIAIDDYMRLRARKSIGSGSDAVKLRVENAKLKRELAKPAEERKTTAAGSNTPKDEAGTAEPAAKAPKNVKDWSDELPGKHKLRQIAGWNALLDTEMRKLYDPDTKDYDGDPEAIADKLLKREIARMMEEEPDDETVKPKPRAPKPKDAVPPASTLRPKAPKPAAAADDGDEDAPKGYADRQKWAIARAMRRARGEEV